MPLVICMFQEFVERDSLKNDCTWEHSAKGVLDYRFSSFVLFVTIAFFLSLFIVFILIPGL
jgi:hypothetical protein